MLWLGRDPFRSKADNGPYHDETGGRTFTSTSSQRHFSIKVNLLLQQKPLVVITLFEKRYIDEEKPCWQAAMLAKLQYVTVFI